MFNHYFDEDRGIVHESTVALFKEIENEKYEAYTSRYVINELTNAPEPKRDKMFKARGQSNPSCIYEKTKDMTPSQLTDYYKNNTEATIQKYGFKVIANASEKRDST